MWQAGCLCRSLAINRRFLRNADLTSDLKQFHRFRKSFEGKKNSTVPFIITHLASALTWRLVILNALWLKPSSDYMIFHNVAMLNYIFPMGPFQLLLDIVFVYNNIKNKSSWLTTFKILEPQLRFLFYLYCQCHLFIRFKILFFVYWQTSLKHFKLCICSQPSQVLHHYSSWFFYKAILYILFYLY